MHRLQAAHLMQVLKSMLAEWTQYTMMHTRCWVVLEGEKLKVLVKYMCCLEKACSTHDVVHSRAIVDSSIALIFCMFCDV